VSIAVQEQCGLINTINNAVGWNVLLSTGQMSEGSVEICNVNDVANNLIWLDNTGPAHQQGNSYSAFPGITFTTTVKRFDKTRAAIVSHRTIVSHEDDQSIFLHALVFQFLQ